MKYHATIDLAEKNSSHTLAYDMVQAHANGRALRVLEVGCASGYWGNLLKMQGHFVVGVEPDIEAATIAGARLDEVFVGLVDDYFRANEDAWFDVISFVDVLEHTADPEAVLKQCRTRLVPGGIIVASIPNVSHLAVRSMLLAGRWDYASTGIMDSTHIRFFTRTTIVGLFSSAAFKLIELTPTTMSSHDVARNYGTRSPLLLRIMACLLAPDTTWRDFQYVLCATPATYNASVQENRRFTEEKKITAATAFKVSVLIKTVVLQLKLSVRRRP